MLRDVLQEALSAAKMSCDHLAMLAGLEPALLEAMLRGEPLASADDISRIARVLGLRSTDFLAGRAAEAPLALFYRSVDQDAVLPDIAAKRVHDPIGRFMCAVRDIADLEWQLEVAPRPLPKLTATPANAGPLWMEEAARELRTALDMADAPIRSVIEVMERLGVAVFLVTEEELDVGIDGASTLLPRPAVLVNMVDSPSGTKPIHRWRMTLAHELAHLLLHGDSRGPIVSPRRARFGVKQDAVRGAPAWRFFDEFEEYERQADALAACFLAPASAVRRTLTTARLDPQSWEAVAKVGGLFGLGRIAAINRLQVVYGFGEPERRRLEDRPALAYPTTTTEAVGANRAGFAPPYLRDLASRAMANGRVTKMHAWEILGLPLDEDAPKGWLKAADSEAPVPPGRAAMSVALRWLREHGFASLFPVRARRSSFRASYIVSIEDAADRGPPRKSAGVLEIDDDMAVSNRLFGRPTIHNG